jgi:hypothetical protein
MSLGKTKSLENSFWIDTLLKRKTINGFERVKRKERSKTSSSCYRNLNYLLLHYKHIISDVKFIFVELWRCFSKLKLTIAEVNIH